MLNLIIGAIIGTVTSIAATILADYLRKPKLDMLIEDPPFDRASPLNAPANQMRFLRLRIFNKQLPRWLQWIEPSPALQCRAAISFHHLDGRNVFGRTMGGRWAGTPEPIPITIVNPDGQQSHIFDTARLNLESRIDIYPGESELLDIASRADEDQNCYGWNNETYLISTPWRNPNWKLDRGRYLIKVAVRSSGRMCIRYYHLANDVSRADFRLTPANQSEVAALSKVD